MKELSIEEKAIAYDKAIEKFDVILNLNTVKESGTIFADDVRKIFPELAESDDEKIRKSIIDLVIKSAQNGGMALHKWESQQMIAYLEKLGNTDLEFFENGENEKREFVGYGFLKCKGDFLSFKEGETYWLEYVGKDNYNVRSDNLLGQTFHITPQQLYIVFRPTTWLEKQTEQNPTDKVEPKFKVGDWITNGIDATFQIRSIEDNMYLRSDDYFIDIETADKNFRLWTIQDAKDGDVLVNWNNTIYLFKGIEEEVVKFYCYYNTNCEEFNTPLDNNSHLGLTEPQFEHHPATKEQRNSLFQKIHEAGYEWDADKKELKKIEQKPAEWEPQTGDTFRKKGTTSPTYHLCNKRDDGITFGFVENREVGISGGEITIFALKDDYELVERPKPIENVVEEELNRALQTKVEQKPTWNEEDKKNRCPLNIKEIKIGDIITYFKHGKKGIILVSSFDAGIYPRCKWGITEIDGTAYGNWAPGAVAYYTATEEEKQLLYNTMPIEVKNWLDSLYEQLKKLREE